MRITLFSVGRLKNGPERELAERYLSRGAAIGRTLGFSGFGDIELIESRASRAQDRKAEESFEIIAKLGGSVLISLDERGKMLTSAVFAETLARLRDAGTGNLCFVIGGPDGLDDTIRAKAIETIAFGAMTLPHQIARIVLSEQIYRAMTILSGHPYHRV